MLNLTLRKVDFNELKVEDISKRPILETLYKFWTKGEAEYIDFLEKHNIDYYKNFSSMAELKETMKNDITNLNAIAEQGLENSFDFKTINFLKSKNLKEIFDHEFVKLTIDLREINDKSKKDEIKDLFLETKSVSLVDFVDVDEDSCSIIYHKKGAYHYNNEPYMCNSRESLTLLENYEVPKDNNFILSRFLLDLSSKLEENDIKESFCVRYGNGDENIKNIEEVIYWGHLSADEKKELKNQLREQKEMNDEAKSLAKQELKAETNAKRNSLTQQEANEALEEKSARLYNVAEFNKQNTKNEIVQKEQTPKNDESKESQIVDIIAKSIELYKAKEQEKLKAKLDKAEKDSANAYSDLKEYLNNGLSILEALKNIQQKYRNDDTINFASLLFSKDILSLKSKEDEIISLEREKDALKNECANAYNEIDKREETISKLRSTLQTKLNEMQNFEYELEQTFEAKLKEREEKMLQELEALQANQEKISNEFKEEINELDLANEELSKENKAINEMNLKLNSQNQALMLQLDNSKKEFENIQEELKAKLDSTQDYIKNLYKLEAQAEVFNDKENMYKEQLKELKEKNALLESRIDTLIHNLQNEENEEKTKKSKRSKDILGN